MTRGMKWTLIGIIALSMFLGILIAELILGLGNMLANVIASFAIGVLDAMLCCSLEYGIEQEAESQ